MVRLESEGNCPNCGAPIRGDECPYCGTAFTRKYDGVDIYDTQGRYLTTLFNSNVFTPNEVRELCGLPPIKEFDVRENYNFLYGTVTPDVTDSKRI